MVERRGAVALRVGQRHPQLGAVQHRGVRVRRLLGVRDARPPAVISPSSPGRIRTSLPRLSRWCTSPSSSQLTVCRPGVRVRRHLHAGLAGDVVRPVVVDEAPGADHPPAHRRQQAADHRALAQRHRPGRQQLADGPGLRAAPRTPRRPARRTMLLTRTTRTTPPPTHVGQLRRSADAPHGHRPPRGRRRRPRPARAAGRGGGSGPRRSSWPSPATARPSPSARSTAATGAACTRSTSPPGTW